MKFFKEIEKSNGSIGWAPDYPALAKHFRETEGLAIADEIAWIWDRDHYRTISDAELKYRCDELTDATPPQVRTFVEVVRTKNYRPREFFESPTGLINVANGVLDVKAGTLTERTRDHFFKYVLPIEFEAVAHCPRWLEFLNFVFEGNEDLAELSAQMFGYILAGGTPWLHKAFVLVGGGRNGKSTFLGVLKALIGSANYAAVPMRQLDRPFSVVSLDGKLANIVTELEGRDLGSESFKIAVAGEELRAAQKFKGEFDLKIQARQVFATNNMPTMNDASIGLVDRLCLIPFKRYIRDYERDGGMEAKLHAELPGIMNWALAGYRRLMKTRKLIEVHAVKAEVTEYREQSDSAYAWFKEWVRPLTAVGSDALPKYQFVSYYRHYLTWCEAETFTAKSKHAFAREVAQHVRLAYPSFIETKPGNRVQLAGPFRVCASTGSYVVPTPWDSFP